MRIYDIRFSIYGRVVEASFGGTTEPAIFKTEAANDHSSFERNEQLGCGSSELELMQVVDLNFSQLVTR